MLEPPSKKAKLPPGADTPPLPPTFMRGFGPKLPAMILHFWKVAQDGERREA